MRNLLRCRRGAVAFATVIALVPLIGVIALGGEAASWYVTKQHAQNAADAAAYSGALKLACTLSGSSCIDQQTVPYRGKEFAAQNGFCNAGDTAYPGSVCATSLPKGTSQSVAINTLTVWKGTNGNFVQATVQQTQPGYLAALLGLSTVNIGATAVASVINLAKPPCVLALTGSISFQGSPNINAPNCGMASNDRANNALDFTGGGMTVNLGSLSAAGGCTGTTTFCSSALTYRAPVTNPFAALDAVTLPTLSNCSGGGLTAYSAATPCKNNNFTLNGNTDLTLPGGVYFISGTLKVNGNASILGTALFILLPGASFSMLGTGNISVTGNASLTAAQLPSVLQPYRSLFADMALYDQSTSPLNIGGTSKYVALKGTIYAPNAAVTFQGNPTISLANGTGCGELIAKSIAFNGNATFDGSGCPASTKPSAQYVSLVQ
jgi:Flp pilus assembly protein TadG